MADQEHLEILKQGMKVWNEWKRQNREVKPDLKKIDLRRADLSRANLSEADLRGADLSWADLRGTNLSSANLKDADLRWANLVLTNLKGANLRSAILNGTFLREVNLMEATLKGAILGKTVFAAIDLSTANGLEETKHLGPSFIDIDTLISSKGKIPKVFLKGCGVPDSIIKSIPSLIGSLEPLQFYSCFISYSSRDQAFAERLYADLQAKGVRCWYAPEDLPGEPKSDME